jgi:uncharacterized protein YdeI (YjbR/CyaY-like superfamily)
LTRDPRIDDYIAKAQPFARPVLEKVRERAHAVLPTIDEGIKWGLPAYSSGGRILVITAAFKAHAALNFWRGEELRGDAANRDAMGQFGRIEGLDDLPGDDVLDGLIKEAAELSSTRRQAPAPKKAPKPALEIHPDFALALSQAPKAKAVLETFPPSAQRDYFEWILEAKQDSTRKSRISTAIEWLAEGKRRHWKYQSS